MSIFGGATGGSAPPTDPASIMEAAAKAEISKNLGGNLGPFILGWSFDFILFGVMLHQILLWSSNFRTEKAFVKLVVIWSGLVSLATTGYGLYYLWITFVLGFGKFAQFAEVRKLAVYGVLDVTTVFPIQMFYLERAYRLNKQRLWIPVLVLPIMIVSVVGGIGINVKAYSLSTVLEGYKMKTWFFLFIGAATAADVLLTGLIMLGLVQSKTGWSTTDKIVNRLIRTSFETQLPGTIFAAAFLIYYALNDTALMNAFFQLVYTKIYVVSLLAVLNYRFTLRKAMETSGQDSSGNQRRTNTFNISNRHQQETMQIDKIKVDTVVYEETVTAIYRSLFLPLGAIHISHKSPELRVGINRQRLPDEESGHSTNFTRDHELVDDFSSSTSLHQMPSLPSLGKDLH